MTGDDAAMMLFGVRYCLARRSYAPGLCCDWLKRKWPEIAKGDREMILRDIRRELDREQDDGFPFSAWQGFANWAEQDASNRERYRALVASV